MSRPPEFFKGLAGRYLEGIAKKGDRLIVLLNLDEILSSAEKIELNAALEDLEPGAETKRVASKSRTTKRASRSRKKSGGKKGG